MYYCYYSILSELQMGKTQGPDSDEEKSTGKERKMQKIIIKKNKIDKIANKNKKKQIKMLECIQQNESNECKIITQNKRNKQSKRKRKINKVNSSNRRKKKLNIKRRSNKQNKNEKVDQKFYQIDQIIKYRRTAEGYIQYFVSWVGYPSTTNCWVDKDRIKGFDLENLQQYLQELSIQSAGSDNTIVEVPKQARKENHNKILHHSQSKQCRQDTIKNPEKGENQLTNSKLNNKVEGYQVICIQDDGENNCNEVRRQIAYPRTRHKNANKVYHFPSYRLNNNKLCNKKGNTKRKIKIIPHPHKYKYRYSRNNASKLSVNKEELEEINQKQEKKEKNEIFLLENSQEQKSKSRSKQEQISHENMPPMKSGLNLQLLHLSLHTLSKEELDILRRFYYPHLA